MAVIAYVFNEIIILCFLYPDRINMAHHVKRLVFLLIARTVVNEMLYLERNCYISLLHSAPSKTYYDFSRERIIGNQISFQRRLKITNAACSPFNYVYKYIFKPMIWLFFLVN